ncbi:MAG: CDP-diacylglycerol--glycerol-3-phosphate 3-phosphatidyltransferase [Verrucomicrobiota bacterium]|nr:CDP-diacylglycerol--glycerol-3-phosphate 3-phosphatidyltransferase [Verrucomicrobiota bacterium]
MTLANYFTLARIFVSPLFPILYLGYAWFAIPLQWLPYILLFFLTLSECSDLFDGFLARKRNQVTDLGKVLDPMADSITHITLFFTFTQGIVQLPLLLVFIFLYRDIFISTLRTICALRGIALAARFSGKVKTALQAIVSILILLLMIPCTQGWLSIDLFQKICLSLVGIAALYTLISAGDYIMANRTHIKQALYTEKNSKI